MAEQPLHICIYTRHRNQLLQEQHNQGFTMLASWSIVVHFVNLLHDNFVPNYPIEWDIDCLLLPIPFLLRFSGKGTGAATPWGYNSLGDLFFTLKKCKDGLKTAKKDDVTCPGSILSFRSSIWCTTEAVENTFPRVITQKMRKVLGFTILVLKTCLIEKKNKNSILANLSEIVRRFQKCKS